MKRLTATSLIFSLIISLVAPIGGDIFASDNVMLGDETVESSVVVDEVVEYEVDLPESGPTPKASGEPAESPATNKNSSQEDPGHMQPQSTPKSDVPIVTPEPPTPTIAPKRKIYISAVQVTGGLAFVELHNSDTKVQSVDGWRAVAEYDDGESCDISLSGYLFGKSKVLLQRSKYADDSQNAMKFDCGLDHQLVEKLSVYDGGDLVERLVFPSVDTQIWIRKNTTATYTTGNFTQDFRAFDMNRDVVTDGFWYNPPATPPLQVLEVLVNPRSCITPDESLDCYDFIKIKNTSDHEVDLGDYRLRSGFSNSTSSANNTEYFSVSLAPGEVKTLTHNSSGGRVSFSANDGTVWFEDVEGVVAYKTEVPPYVGSDLTSKKGLSWAYDNSSASWRWGVPSPETEENYFPVFEESAKKSVVRQLKPCAPHQFRNPATNRCKNIAQASTLKPCKPGQYRSEETNRCRSSATAVSALKPCAPDQFRNPATNRCKKVSTASSNLKPCAEGYKRNPATNRCKKVLSDTAPNADFAPEDVAMVAGSTMGWWVFGGAGLLALGVAGWQWRWEMARLFRRVGSVFVTGGK